MRFNELLAICILAGSVICAGCRGNCDAACLPTVTFALATPLGGQNIDVEFRNDSGSSIGSLNCAQTAGKVSCSSSVPSSELLNPTFDAQNRLVSISWDQVPSGIVEITISADGATAVDQKFTYSPQAVQGACGPCLAPVTFTVTN